MLRTGSDLPYRMTVHPRGDGIICAFQKSCRFFFFICFFIDSFVFLFINVLLKSEKYFRLKYLMVQGIYIDII